MQISTDLRNRKQIRKRVRQYDELESNRNNVFPSKFEEPKESVIAEFETLVNAEDFINLVLPKETRDRFRIEHI